MTFQSTHFSIGPALDGILLACRGDLGLESDSALFSEEGLWGDNLLHLTPSRGAVPQATHHKWMGGWMGAGPFYLAGWLAIYPFIQYVFIY